MMVHCLSNYVWGRQFPKLDLIFEVTEALDGDLDLLELDPLELDLELELEEDLDPEPEPLELEPESLDRDFLSFFFVLCVDMIG